MAQKLKLHSPVGADPLIWKWPIPTSEGKDGPEEILDTIRLVCEDYPELIKPLENRILKDGEDFSEYDFEQTRALCERYNKAIDSLRQLIKGQPRQRAVSKQPSMKQLKHILQQCYNHSVKDPEKLNHYEPFSPEVYGETSFELVEQVIKYVKFSECDYFIDLGSGVGQVVLQVSAATNCKFCYGIEKAEWPAEYAVGMEREFKKWMRWYGKEHGDFKIDKGDFLNDGIKDKLNNATIVFVNNFAFGPVVDHELKQLFEKHLKEGARIVSSKAFCPLNFRITARTLSDIGTIMQVEELSPLCGAVSWTGKPFAYYVHTIDRTLLEKYFLRMKNPDKKDEVEPRKDRKGRPLMSIRDKINGALSGKTDPNPTGRWRRGKASSQNDTDSPLTAAKILDFDSGSNSSFTNSSYTNSGSNFAADESSIVYGPTTRRQWNEYVKRPPSQSGTDNDSSAAEMIPLETTKIQIMEAPLKKKRMRTMKCLNSGALGLRQSQVGKKIGEDIPLVKSKAAVKLRPRQRRRTRSTTVARKTAGVTSPLAGSASSTNHPLAHPGSVPAPSLESLNLLHAHTIMSTSGRDAAEKVSYNDRRMTESSNAFFKPTVQKQTVSMLEKEAGFLQMIETMKQRFLSFLTFMQTPEYRTLLVLQIEQEKRRNSTLKNQIEGLEKDISVLQKEGVRLIKDRLKEMGIKADTPKELIHQAKDMMLRHHELKSQTASLEAQITALQTEHQQKVVIKKKLMSKKFAPKIENGFHEHVYHMQQEKERLDQQKLLANINRLYAELQHLQAANSPYVARLDTSADSADNTRSHIPDNKSCLKEMGGYSTLPLANAFTIQEKLDMKENYDIFGTVLSMVKKEVTAALQNGLVSNIDDANSLVNGTALKTEADCVGNAKNETGFKEAEKPAALSGEFQSGSVTWAAKEMAGPKLASAKPSQATSFVSASEMLMEASKQAAMTTQILPQSTWTSNTTKDGVPSVASPRILPPGTRIDIKKSSRLNGMTRTTRARSAQHVYPKILPSSGNVCNLTMRPSLANDGAHLGILPSLMVYTENEKSATEGLISLMDSSSMPSSGHQDSFAPRVPASLSSYTPNTNRDFQPSSVNEHSSPDIKPPILAANMIIAGSRGSSHLSKDPLPSCAISPAPSCSSSSLHGFAQVPVVASSSLLGSSSHQNKQVQDTVSLMTSLPRPIPSQVNVVSSLSKNGLTKHKNYDTSLIQRPIKIRTLDIGKNEPTSVLSSLFRSPAVPQQPHQLLSSSAVGQTTVTYNGHMSKTEQNHFTASHSVVNAHTSTTIPASVSVRPASYPLVTIQSPHTLPISQCNNGSHQSLLKILQQKPIVISQSNGVINSSIINSSSGSTSLLVSPAIPSQGKFQAADLQAVKLVPQNGKDGIGVLDPSEPTCRVLDPSEPTCRVLDPSEPTCHVLSESELPASAGEVEHQSPDLPQDCGQNVCHVSPSPEICCPKDDLPQDCGQNVCHVSPSPEICCPKDDLPQDCGQNVCHVSYSTEICCAKDDLPQDCGQNVYHVSHSPEISSAMVDLPQDCGQNVFHVSPSPEISSATVDLPQDCGQNVFHVSPSPEIGCTTVDLPQDCGQNVCQISPSPEIDCAKDDLPQDCRQSVCHVSHSPEISCSKDDLPQDCRQNVCSETPSIDCAQNESLPCVSSWNSITSNSSIRPLTKQEVIEQNTETLNTCKLTYAIINPPGNNLATVEPALLAENSCTVKDKFTGDILRTQATLIDYDHEEFSLVKGQSSNSGPINKDLLENKLKVTTQISDTGGKPDVTCLSETEREPGEIYDSDSEFESFAALPPSAAFVKRNSDIISNKNLCLSNVDETSRSSPDVHVRYVTLAKTSLISCHRKEKQKNFKTDLPKRKHKSLKNERENKKARYSINEKGLMDKVFKRKEEVSSRKITSQFSRNVCTDKPRIKSLFHQETKNGPDIRVPCHLKKTTNSHLGSRSSCSNFGRMRRGYIRSHPHSRSERHHSKKTSSHWSSENPDVSRSNGGHVLKTFMQNAELDAAFCHNSRPTPEAHASKYYNGNNSCHSSQSSHARRRQHNHSSLVSHSAISRQESNLSCTLSPTIQRQSRSKHQLQTFENINCSVRRQQEVSLLSLCSKSGSYELSKQNTFVENLKGFDPSKINRFGRYSALTYKQSKVGEKAKSHGLLKYSSRASSLELQSQISPRILPEFSVKHRSSSPGPAKLSRACTPTFYNNYDKGIRCSDNSRSSSGDVMDRCRKHTTSFCDSFYAKSSNKNRFRDNASTHVGCARSSSVSKEVLLSQHLKFNYLKQNCSSSKRQKRYKSSKKMVPLKKSAPIQAAYAFKNNGEQESLFEKGEAQMPSRDSSARRVIRLIKRKESAQPSPTRSNMYKDRQRTERIPRKGSSSDSFQSASPTKVPKLVKRISNDRHIFGQLSEKIAKNTHTFIEEETGILSQIVPNNDKPAADTAFVSVTMNSPFGIMTPKSSPSSQVEDKSWESSFEELTPNGSRKMKSKMLADNTKKTVKTLRKRIESMCAVDENPLIFPPTPVKTPGDISRPVSPLIEQSEADRVTGVLKWQGVADSVVQKGPQTPPGSPLFSHTQLSRCSSTSTDSSSLGSSLDSSESISSSSTISESSYEVRSRAKQIVPHPGQKRTVRKMSMPAASVTSQFQVCSTVSTADVGGIDWKTHTAVLPTCPIQGGSSSKDESTSLLPSFVVTQTSSPGYQRLTSESLADPRGLTKSSDSESRHYSVHSKTSHLEFSPLSKVSSSVSGQKTYYNSAVCDTSKITTQKSTITDKAATISTELAKKAADVVKNLSTVITQLTETNAKLTKKKEAICHGNIADKTLLNEQLSSHMHTKVAPIDYNQNVCYVSTSLGSTSIYDANLTHKPSVSEQKVSFTDEIFTTQNNMPPENLTTGESHNSAVLTGCVESVPRHSNHTTNQVHSCAPAYRLSPVLPSDCRDMISNKKPALSSAPRRFPDKIQSLPILHKQIKSPYPHQTVHQAAAKSAQFHPSRVLAVRTTQHAMAPPRQHLSICQEPAPIIPLQAPPFPPPLSTIVHQPVHRPRSPQHKFAPQRAHDYSPHFSNRPLRAPGIHILRQNFGFRFPIPDPYRNFSNPQQSLSCGPHPHSRPHPFMTKARKPDYPDSRGPHDYDEIEHRRLAALDHNLFPSLPSPCGLTPWNLPSTSYGNGWTPADTDHRSHPHSSSHLPYAKH